MRKKKKCFLLQKALLFFLRYMYPQKTKKNQKNPQTNQKLQTKTYIWKNYVICLLGKAMLSNSILHRNYLY